MPPASSPLSSGDRAFAAHIVGRIERSRKPVAQLPPMQQIAFEPADLYGPADRRRRRTFQSQKGHRGRSLFVGTTRFADRWSDRMRAGDRGCSEFERPISLVGPRRVDHCPSVSTSNKYLTRTRPCRLARPVNQFRSAERYARRLKLLHPLDEPTGVGGCFRGMRFLAWETCIPAGRADKGITFMSTFLRIEKRIHPRDKHAGSESVGNGNPAGPTVLRSIGSCLLFPTIKAEERER